VAIPRRGVSDSGEVAWLVLVRQAAHDYLHNSVVMPARELREEEAPIMRHRRTPLRRFPESRLFNHTRGGGISTL
jgi:hypothetical protein